MDRVERPWGYFEQYVKNTSVTVKMLVLNKGQRLSLQRHEHRDEMWIPLRGLGIAEIGDTTISMFRYGSEPIWIPRGTPHRLAAWEHVDGQLWVLEIAFGEFDEADEVRIEDDYGRAFPSATKSVE